MQSHPLVYKHVENILFRLVCNGDRGGDATTDPPYRPRYCEGVVPLTRRNWRAK